MLLTTLLFSNYPGKAADCSSFKAKQQLPCWQNQNIQCTGLCASSQEGSLQTHGVSSNLPEIREHCTQRQRSLAIIFSFHISAFFNCLISLSYDSQIWVPLGKSWQVLSVSRQSRDEEDPYPVVRSHSLSLHVGGFFWMPYYLQSVHLEHSRRGLRM